MLGYSFKFYDEQLETEFIQQIRKLSMTLLNNDYMEINFDIPWALARNVTSGSGYSTINHFIDLYNLYYENEYKYAHKYLIVQKIASWIEKPMTNFNQFYKMMGYLREFNEIVGSEYINDSLTRYNVVWYSYYKER